jgi:hypothetical protein
LIIDRIGLGVEAVAVDVRVVCAGLDAEGLTELVRNLGEAIQAVDVDEVRPGTAGLVPAGGKSGEVLAVGALVVTLAPTVIDALMAVLSSWLSRQPRDVAVEIDGQRFSGPVSRSQRDQLVAAYLRRLDRES